MSGDLELESALCIDETFVERRNWVGFPCLVSTLVFDKYFCLAATGQRDNNNMTKAGRFVSTGLSSPLEKTESGRCRARARALPAQNSRTSSL